MTEPTTPSAENSYTQRRLKEFDEKFKSHHYGVFKDGAYYNPEYLPLTIENIKSFLSDSIHQAEQRMMKENKALTVKLAALEREAKFGNITYKEAVRLQEENAKMREALTRLDELTQGFDSPNQCLILWGQIAEVVRTVLKSRPTL